MQDQLLTTAQAARFLQLKKGTLEQLRWRGDGPPFIRLSRRAVRYRRADLDEWLDARTVDAERTA